MKMAIIVGGANGIGSAVARQLIKRDYYLLILDKAVPSETELPKDHYTYVECNLREPNEDLYKELAADPEVEVLMITAGYGRVADFEYIHTAEIQNMMQVNTVSTIKIIRHFYERIKSEAPFFTGIMGSIAGLVSSPAFSVYAASKAAICRFVESVNVELEVAGVNNRILNVSPGTVKGTKFHGADNNPELTEALSCQITDKLLSSCELFIPEYDEIYGGVIERYKVDPHKYGVESYEYKKNAGRIANKKGVRIGYLSGTFDLFHVGHLNLIKKAKQYCDYLIVGVHPDASHKGKQTFIPFEERMAVVGGCKYVDRVVACCREDSDAWDRHHYDVLFVGSDYKGTERFRKYEEYFADKGVEIMYFDYTQGTSSTQIREKIVKDALADLNTKKGEANS
ncbi:MAG: SDR family NAD(P)-dependent oxidoreductase [Clostridia bacterium]|nr:SDR family NAD(P)-dependent oxidoreductase [Clostridia bacterium]